MKELIEIFLIYFKIGAFTIGGGYAMLPLIQVEVVDNKEWMTNEEFMDMFAVIQSAPGPIAVNSAVFIGYKIKGVKGAIAATIGSVLPSFSIILLIAIFFKNFRGYGFVDSIFKGVRPAIVALISAAVYRLSKSMEYSFTGISLFLITLISIVLLNIHPIILILVSGSIGVLLGERARERGKK